MSGVFWPPGEPEFDIGFQTHRAALVCSRGHAKSYDVTSAHSGSLGYCRECGAVIHGRCPACGLRIRGLNFYPGIIVTPDYHPPKFCDGCGEPMPWAGRRERFYQLQNILDQEDIDPVDRLLVQRDLQRLLDSEDMDAGRQAEIWAKIKTRAPGILAGGGLRIAQSVMTAAIKAGLHLGS